MGTKKVIRISSLIAGTGLLAYGFYRHFAYQTELLKQFCYKIENYKLLKVTNKSIIMRFDIAIENKSDLEIKISGYDLDLYLNTKKVISVKSKNKVVIKPKSFNNIKVYAEFDPSLKFKLDYLLQLIGYFMISKESIDISVKGKISASSGFLRAANVPINLYYNLAEIMNTNNDNIKKQCRV